MSGSQICKNASDNKYNDCPPRMSDGRQFTDYRPKCDIVFGGVPQPMSSYDYRMFLTNHAGDIMNKNREMATLSSSCSWCDRTVGPDAKTEQSCDDRVCGFSAGAQDGIGMTNDSTAAAGGGLAPWQGASFAST
jgi:hypothetical protein